MDPAEHAQPDVEPGADTERAVAWTLMVAGGEAHGWVDAQGGVGRIESARGGLARDPRSLFEELDRRYPGVRWLSSAG